MKKVFFALLLSGTIGNGFAQQTDNHGVASAATAFFNSWNRHDFSDMPNYATEDFSFVISPGIFWKGRNQVQSQHQIAHNTIMKNTSFTPDQQTLSTRFITPDVAIVNMVAKMGAFYPPDGVDHGNNKSGGNRIMITLVEIKKDGKWLLTAGQGTGIDPQVEATLQQ